MSTDQELAGQVGRELERRADAVAPAHLTFEDVRGRARSIRRRRRGAAVAVAAAVVAVALPVGLQVADRGETRPAPAEPAPTPRADGTFPLRLAGLPAGDGPAVPYLPHQGEPRVVTPEGEVPLDVRYHQVVPYGDGYVAVGGGDNPSQTNVRLHLLDADHQRVGDLGPVGDRIVVSPDRSRVAWVEIGEDDSSTLAVATDGGEPERTPLPTPSGHPIGFLPDGGVSVGVEDRDGTSFAVVRDGSVTPVDGFDFLWGSSSGSGLLTGQTDYRAATDSQCSGATEEGARTPLWEKCDLVLGDLNAGGDLVVGFTAPLLPQSGSVAVLDARTGEVLVTWTGVDGSATAANAAWEDDDTLLVLVQEGRQQALVRLELDGRAEVATESWRVDDLSVAVDFAEPPLGAVR